MFCLQVKKQMNRKISRRDYQSQSKDSGRMSGKERLEMMFQCRSNRALRQLNVNSKKHSEITLWFLVSVTYYIMILLTEIVNLRSGKYLGQLVAEMGSGN